MFVSKIARFLHDFAIVISHPSPNGMNENRQRYMYTRFNYP